jgi:large subunit ribosomal protein L29
MKKAMKDIVNKNDKELKDLLKEKREERYKLNLDNRQNKLKNSRSLFNSRKELARILTIMRERELSKTEEPKVEAGGVK